MNGPWNKVRCYFKAIPARIAGAAREGQELPRISGVRHAAWALVFFILGIVAAWVGVERTNYFMILAGWVSTVHGSRKLQLNIGHACAHGTVTGDESRDRLMGQIIHFAVIANEFNAYQTSHTKIHHNWRVLATHDDPTFLSLAQAGIRPGIAKVELYRRLMCACFSPKFHALVLWDRINSHMMRAGTYRVAFLTFWLSVFVGLTLSRSWLAFTIAVIAPLVWGYQTAQLLRFCVEHRLPTIPLRPRPSAEMQELTDAIILRPTDPVDLTIRVLVLTCDSVAHDFHHYNPKSLECELRFGSGRGGARGT
jgi:fatty acid desaturase